MSAEAPQTPSKGQSPTLLTWGAKVAQYIKEAEKERQAREKVVREAEQKAKETMLAKYEGQWNANMEKMMEDKMEQLITPDNDLLLINRVMCVVCAVEETDDHQKSLYAVQAARHEWVTQWASRERFRVTPDFETAYNNDTKCHQATASWRLRPNKELMSAEPASLVEEAGSAPAKTSAAAPAKTSAAAPAKTGASPL